MALQLRESEKEQTRAKFPEENLMDREVIMLCLQRKGLYGREHGLNSPFMYNPVPDKTF